MALLFNENKTFFYKNELVENDESLKSKLFLPEYFKEDRELKGLYLSISDTKTSKNKGLLHFSAKIFLDSDKEVLLYSEVHSCDLDISSENTPNFYVQGYNYLKTIDKYKDSKDC